MFPPLFDALSPLAPPPVHPRHILVQIRIVSLVVLLLYTTFLHPLFHLLHTSSLYTFTSPYRYHHFSYRLLFARFFELSPIDYNTCTHIDIIHDHLAPIAPPIINLVHTLHRVGPNMLRALLPPHS